MANMANCGVMFGVTNLDEKKHNVRPVKADGIPNGHHISNYSEFLLTDNKNARLCLVNDQILSNFFKDQ